MKGEHRGARGCGGHGDGTRGRRCRRPAGRGGPRRRGDRGPARRRRVPVLRVRALEDDASGGWALGRGRRVQGMAGRARSRRTGRRSQRASARRRPTTGTTASRSSDSSPRGVASCAAGARLTGPGRVSVGGPGVRGGARRRHQHRALSPSHPCARGWPRYSLLDEPGGHRDDRGPAVAGRPRRRGRSASSSARSSARFGAR